MYDIARTRILESTAGRSNTEFLSGVDLDVVEGCITDAKERIQSFHRQIANLEERIQQEEDNIITLRRAVAPHKRLPPELLAQIFVQTLPDVSVTLPFYAAATPWTLRAVCSSWRNVALSEPRLWNDIVMMSQPYYFSRAWYRFLNKHILHPGLLSLKTYVRDYGESRLFILEEIIIPNLSRLHHLVLRATRNELVDISEFSSPELVNLTVNISNDTPERVGTVVANDMPFFNGMIRLRHLCLMVTGQPRKPPPTIPWEQLTTLTVALDVSWAADILSRCENVINCRLVIVKGNTSPLDHGATALSPVRVPKLERLTVANSSGRIGDLHPLLDSLTLPSLSGLTVSWNPLPHHCDTIYRLITRSGCSLTTLHILPHDDYGEKDHIDPALGNLLDSLHPGSIYELHTPQICYPLEVLEKIAASKLFPQLASFIFHDNARYTFDAVRLKEVITRRSYNGVTAGPRFEIVREVIR